MATNTNAPGNVNTGFSVLGTTNIVWGTGNAISQSYIVVSIDESEKVEQYYIENASGVEAGRVILNHGKRWNITVVDDVSITPPTVGDTVVLWTHSTGNSAAATSNAVVINNDVRAARKTEGQRVLQCEKLTLITPG